MKAAMVMAFDFGLKRIGIAVGNAELETSNALTTISARDGIPDWNQIEKLINEWGPTQIVVGDPLNFDGSDSEMATRARRFSRRLEARFGLPCELIDERLSSIEAKALCKQSNARSQHLDAVAAEIILQTWFDQRP